MGSSSDSPAQYIHLVHHLIEECLVLKMSKEECMEALSRHANIHPIITSTVWKELEKENPQFFDAYSKMQETGSESESGSSRSTITRESKDTDV